MNEIVVKEKEIQKKIFTIRNQQVILDRDLAQLYHVETRTLKQAVKRKINRFPKDFMFELTDTEIGFLVSQSVIPSKKYFGGAKPFAFTEQGVSMLSSVLTSETAVAINIAIFRAFTKMRNFITTNEIIFQKFNFIEQKFLKYDHNFEEIYKAIETKQLKPKQGIYFNGQIFDAYIFVSGLIKSASKQIILIDNYIDETVLTLFSKRKKDVIVTIYTKRISNQLKLDLEKFNQQYSPVIIKEFKDAHDRFLIIDNTELYHFGASLKDLGKKWFAFSKFDKKTMEIINRLKID